MDATLVSLLAYAGLRPGEALALRWDDLRSRTILVQNALALGEVKDTKTRRARSVRLLAPLAADLSDWRDACGDPDGGDLVFPRADGAPWSDYDYRNWRKRVFKKTAKAVGLTLSRRYDLRHAFVSLLLAEGRTVVDIAAQAGHSPTMTLDTYGHVIDELDPAHRRSAEELISDVREAGVRILCAYEAELAAAAASEKKKTPGTSRGSLASPLRDSNPGPPPYHSSRQGGTGGHR
jgi:integrase